MNEPLQLVIVLYHMKWSQLPSKKTLTNFLKKRPDSHLLIVDNSLEAQTDPFFKEANVNYQHEPSNPGLAKAYNAGLAFANTTKKPWLILLDQDTALTEEYFDILSEYLSLNKQVVCLVPQMIANQKQISPLLAKNYIDRHWTYPKVGVSNERIMAINSASIWQVIFLNQIGGFDLDFPLDFLDHWLFYQVHAQKRSVAILPVYLQHDLSVLHYQTMSIKRYKSILQAEKKYYTQIEPILKKRHIKQLKLRLVKQFFTLKNRKIWKATWQCLKEMRKE